MGYIYINPVPAQCLFVIFGCGMFWGEGGAFVNMQTPTWQVANDAF